MRISDWSSDVCSSDLNVLGGEEGRGFYQLMGELPQERLVIAVGAMKPTDRALDTTVEYVKQRKAFGHTIWDFQNTQFVLADLKARGTAAKVVLNDCIPKVRSQGHTPALHEPMPSRYAVVRLNKTQNPRHITQS